MLENLTAEQKEFIDKLVGERDKIIGNLNKLNKFLYNGEGNKIGGNARYLLEEQKDVMERYVDVLNRRIDTYIADCMSPMVCSTDGECRADI